jgi:hypothetical protein
MSAPSWRMERLERTGTIRFPAARPLLAWLLAATLTMGAVALLDRATGADAPARAEVWTPRPAPAAAIAGLDAIAPVAISEWPRGPEPVAGIAFVRCTRLWRALPDGSRQTLILDMQGISSPTFAPDARTVAFIRDGRELWMTGVDGSGTKMIGAIASDGSSLAATRAVNLTWSPNGKMLGFGLVTAGHDLWTGGASLWTLDLRTGAFERQGAGWPVPSWQQRRLAYSSWKAETGPWLNARSHREDRLLSQDGAPLAVTFNRGQWSGIWDRGVAVLRRVDEVTVLSYRRNPWKRHDKLTVEAPAGFHFAERSRPVLSQDGSVVFVELVDSGGGADLGMFDSRTRTWDVIDYAWDADMSPAPSVLGPVEAFRARNVAIDLLASAGGKGPKARLLLEGELDAELLPFKSWVQQVVHQPEKVGSDWVVPTIAFGRTEHGFAYRELSISVATVDGRLLADPQARSPLRYVRTMDDALGFLRTALPGIDIVAPAGLPSGATLAKRDPVGAYTWAQGGTGTINLQTPDAASAGYGDLHFSYGAVSFNLGCGGEVNSEPEDLDGTPALSGKLGKTRQVLWPATPKTEDQATFTVFGELPKDELLDMARAMEATR